MWGAFLNSMPIPQPSLFSEPTTLRERVEARIEDVRGNKALSPEEDSVLSILIALWEVKPITQREIAHTERWLGCHPRHEPDIVNDELETTVRRVRAIIRELRVTHEIAILSTTGKEKGYYLPSSQEDAASFLDSMERKSRASAKSHMITYHSLSKALGLRSAYFERLREVLPDDTEE